ncbi:hypothetical protein [Streptomyces sp. NPDC055099]
MTSPVLPSGHGTLLSGGMLLGVSAYSSDLELSVGDVSGSGVEVDVATNLLDGTVRLAVLCADEIFLSPGDAELVAQALLRAAERGRRVAGG